MSPDAPGSQNLESRARPDDRDTLLRLLADAEQRVSAIPDLELRIAELEEELGRARADAARALTELAQLDRTWMYLRRALRYFRPYIGLLKRARRTLRHQ